MDTVSYLQNKKFHKAFDFENKRLPDGPVDLGGEGGLADDGNP